MNIKLHLDLKILPTHRVSVFIFSSFRLQTWHRHGIFFTNHEIHLAKCFNVKEPLFNVKKKIKLPLSLF